jgi:ABC-type antimicrobial peptide transport system permease subunit
VAWQAATLVVLAFAIGAPTGLLLGRLLWEVVATRLLGVVSEPVLAWGVTMLLLPLTLVSAVLISIWPAAVARRTKPAAVLRTE